MSAIEIVPPRASWTDEFALLADELRHVLGATALHIDHVGSTSVPELPAKDVIDAQVTVCDERTLAEACKRLEEAGFPVNHDGRDHVVAGVSADAALWRKGFAHERPGQRRANIHIRIEGRPNQRYALLFRDYLRVHPVTAQSYAEFKRRAAAILHDDSARYADLKDPVCDLVYLPATLWAADLGWQPH